MGAKKRIDCNRNEEREVKLYILMTIPYINAIFIYKQTINKK